MSGNADGSLTIDTELDSQGFDKGSDKLLKAVEDLTSAVDNFGDNMMQSFQAVIPILQNIGNTVTQIYSTINTSGQQAVATSEQVVSGEQSVAAAAEQVAAAVKRQVGTVTEATTAEQRATNAAKGATAAMSAQANTAVDMGAKVDAATQGAAQNFQQAGQQAQELGTDISEAVQSSTFDREINAAGRSCATLSTQLQRIADSARVGLNTDAQVVRFQMAVEKARDSVVRMQSHLVSLSSQQISTVEYEELATATKKAEQALFNLYNRREVMEQMGVSKKSNEWQRLAVLIENAEYKLNNYERAEAGMWDNGTAFQTGINTAQYQKIATDLAQMCERLKEYEAMAAKFDTVSAPATQSEQSLKRVDTELKKKPGDTQRASSGFQRFGSVLKTVSSTALRTAGTLAKMSLKAVASTAKAVGNGFKSAAKGIKNFITRTKSASASSKGLVKQLTSLKTMLLSKIKAAIISSIWNGAKESLQDLAKFSTEFDKSMSNIKNSAKELSANLGVTLGELIKAVEPMLTQLMDMLSRAITYINAFFAMMQGKTTMTVAKKQTESYAESLDDAAESAEELKNQVYGFDQLNKRTDTKNDKKDNSSNLYEEVPIDSVLPDDIKELIKNENWQGIGNKIAEELNTKLKTIDDWINNVLRPEGVKWAKNIAEILNGLVDGLDWTSLGKTLADGINALADIFNTFYTTFDFEKLGIGIGEGVNGLFDNVEWDLLGQTFANRWNALIDLIYGIVTTVNWSNIGDSFAEYFNSAFFTFDWDKAADTISIGFNGIIATVQHFMDGVDWRAVGSTIGETFNRLGRDIDWNATSTAIATGLNGISEIIDGFFSSVDWEARGAQFAEGANTLVSGIKWGDIGENLSEGFNSLLHFLNTFISEIDWTNMGSSVAEGTNSVFETVDWKGIADGINEAISSLFDLVRGFVTDLDWESLGTIIEESTTTLIKGLDWEGLGTTIGELIYGLLDGVISFIANIDLGDLVQVILKGVGDLIGSINIWGILASIVELIVALVVQIPGIVVGALGGLADLLAGLFKSIGLDSVAGFFEGIGDAMEDANSWLRENLVDPAVNWVKELLGIHSPSTVFSEIGGYIIEGLLQGINDTWDGITRFFGSAFEGIKSIFSSENWGSIGTNLVSGMQSGITQSWTGLTATVGGLAGALTGTANRAFGIRSPSKVWAQIGEYLDAGLGKGLQGGEKDVLKTVSNIAQNMNDELQTEKPVLDMKVGEGEVVTQLSSITQRLSNIATVFQAINEALSGIGELRVPVIATGSEVPYKTKISASETTGNVDTTEISEGLSNQNELMNDTNYLLRQILSIVQKLKLNIDGDTLMKALSTAQRGAVRSYGGV